VSGVGGPLSVQPSVSITPWPLLVFVFGLYAGGYVLLCGTGGYSGADLSGVFRRRSRTRTSSHHSHTFAPGTTEANENGESNPSGEAADPQNDAYSWQHDIAQDEDDDALLSSVTEVANTMLMQSGQGTSSLGGSVLNAGHILRGIDMEWRNIL
jgi:hypothetical protein